MRRLHNLHKTGQPFKLWKTETVILLKDYHPKGFKEEWLDAGEEVWATLTPDGTIDLSAGEGKFMDNAKEGVDFK